MDRTPIYTVSNGDRTRTVVLINHATDPWYDALEADGTPCEILATTLFEALGRIVDGLARDGKTVTVVPA